jgi:pre-rRNA-processing protein RIX1
MTTPALQSFLAHCLASIGSGDGPNYQVHGRPKLLICVLQSFILLLPRHPASFRPRVNDLRKVLSRLSAPTPSCPNNGARRFSERESALARRLLALLPHCATKNGSAEEWSRNFDETLQHVIRTADYVFRAVQETTVASTRRRCYVEIVGTYRNVVKDDIDDFLGLEPWEGINAGCERLIGCVKILEAFIATNSQVSLSLPVAAIWENVERIISAHGPFTTAAGEVVQPNIHPEADREERESLWAQLPLLHEATLRLLWTLLRRLGNLSLGLAELCLDRLAWIFEREHRRKNLRCLIYDITGDIVTSVGPTMKKSQVIVLQPLLLAACTDTRGLLADSDDQNDFTALAQGQNGALLGQTKSKDSVASTVPRSSASDGLQNSALRLMHHLLYSVSSEHLPPALRTNIDRAVVLAQDEAALLASVLNPNRQTINGKDSSSSLPFLARAYPASDSVEALLRPRLPVILAPRQTQENDEMEVEELVQIPPGTGTAISGLQDEDGENQLNGGAAIDSNLNLAAPNDDVVASPKRLRTASPEPRTSSHLADDRPPPPKRVREDVPIQADSDSSLSVGQQWRNETSAPGRDEAVNVVEVREEPSDNDSEVPPVQLPSDFEDSEDEN